MFILDAQRAPDVVGAFDRYREYLEEVRGSMPPSAYALATSDWYFGFHDHKAPHDAWLESIEISEPSSGKRSEERYTSIRIRLLAAFHDGYIELFYPRVFSYSLSSIDTSRGLQDWRYDEFRVSEEGRLIHEIEWSGAWATARWIIEASDVEYSWTPRERPAPEHE